MHVPLSFFLIRFVIVHVLHPYSSIIKSAAWKKPRPHKGAKSLKKCWLTDYSLRKWRLCIDSCILSLRYVLLHNCNNYWSITIGHTTSNDIIRQSQVVNLYKTDDSKADTPSIPGVSVSVRLDLRMSSWWWVVLLRSLSGKYSWERYGTPYPPSYWLNSTTNVLLGE